MLPKIKVNSHNYEIENINKDLNLNIKYFSDIQHTYGFNNKKLDKIFNSIF